MRFYLSAVSTFIILCSGRAIAAPHPMHTAIVASIEAITVTMDELKEKVFEQDVRSLSLLLKMATTLIDRNARAGLPPPELEFVYQQTDLDLKTPKDRATMVERLKQFRAQNPNPETDLGGSAAAVIALVDHLTISLDDKIKEYETTAHKMSRSVMIAEDVPALKNLISSFVSTLRVLQREYRTVIKQWETISFQLTEMQLNSVNKIEISQKQKDTTGAAMRALFNQKMPIDAEIKLLHKSIETAKIALGIPLSCGPILE